MGPSQTQKLLYSKGNHIQNEETVLRMGKKKFVNKLSDKGLISKIHTVYAIQ